MGLCGRVFSARGICNIFTAFRITEGYIIYADSQWAIRVLQVVLEIQLGKGSLTRHGQVTYVGRARRVSRVLQRGREAGACLRRDGSP